MTNKVAPPRWHYVLTTVAVLAVTAMTFWVASAPPKPQENPFILAPVQCDSASDKTASLKAQQLTKLFLVSERATQAEFRRVVPRPYCSLAPLEIRAGATVNREVYLLAFNPAVVVIVAFEDGQYLGFRMRPLKKGAANIGLGNHLQLYQNWTIKVGDQFGGVPVVGVLGQVTLKLGGKSAVAPFDGISSLSKSGCLRFDALDVPGYAFQFCGLDNPRVGLVNQGDALGSSNFLSMGVLRRQKNGTFAFIEPATTVLDRVVSKLANKGG